MAEMWHDKDAMAYMKRNELGLYPLYGNKERRTGVAEYMAENDMGWWVVGFGANMKNIIADRLFGMEESRTEKNKLLSGKAHAVSYVFIHPYLKPIAAIPQLDIHALQYFENFCDVRLTGDRKHLEETLTALIREAVGRQGKEWGRRHVAMEVSHKGLLPLMSRIDAGSYTFFEYLLKENVPWEKKPEYYVLSSGNIISLALATLTERQVESHKDAAALISKIMKYTFEYIRLNIEDGNTVTENDVAKFIRREYERNSLVPFDPPPWDALVAATPASHPHYAPDPNFDDIREGKNHEIKRGSLVLIDVTARLKGNPNNIQADITWMGFVGKKNDPKLAKFQKIFKVVAESRDAAVELVRKRGDDEELLQGYEIDHCARNIIKKKLHCIKPDHCIHEIGHGIDTEAHGIGAGPTGYKYMDDRHILPGLLFSVEPGYYLEPSDIEEKKDPYEVGPFAMRSEIDVLIRLNPDDGKIYPVVSTSRQNKILPILEDKWDESFKLVEDY